MRIFLWSLLAIALVTGGAVVYFFLRDSSGVTAARPPLGGVDDAPAPGAPDQPLAPKDYWPRFRGPDGSGVSADPNVPAAWSVTRNLAWQLDLPGPGSSSPIVWDDRVFVTCYSGYGDG